MKQKVYLKITLNPEDPDDLELINELLKHRKKGTYMKYAALLYLRGIKRKSNTQESPPVSAVEKIEEIYEKKPEPILVSNSSSDLLIDGYNFSETFGIEN